MSNDHKYNQNLLIGAAMVAGILGTLTTLLHSKNHPKGWKEQAKDVANQVLDKGDILNKKMMLGGVAGGLVGVATALLLAPKSGSELLKDLSHPFSHTTKHAKTSAHKKTAKKAHAKTPSTKAVHPTSTKSSRKTAGKKKTKTVSPVKKTSVRRAARKVAGEVENAAAAANALV